MPIILKGATSGQVTLDTPAIAGTNNLELPAATGTIQLLKLETAQATTSGTSINFTGIPSWAKKITVMFQGVSTNGTSLVQIQLGTSGGIETTGYISTRYSGAYSSATTGFLGFNGGAAEIGSGHMIFTNISGNVWINSGLGKTATNNIAMVAGDKTLSGTLDRVRLTTVNGTDTFDAGSVNILIEGN